jgi:hypothetical protein
MSRTRVVAVSCPRCGWTTARRRSASFGRCPWCAQGLVARGSGAVVPVDAPHPPAGLRTHDAPWPELVAAALAAAEGHR